MQKLRKIIVMSAVACIIGIFSIGLIFSAEILVRVISPTISRGMLVDVTLFPYKHYVVTTHPANLRAGLGNDIVWDSYFAKGGECSKEGVSVQFNSDGFRTHELKNVPPKEPNELRIIITGGSASISWNIGEACTLDNQLYALFAKHYPNKKVRIFNLGNGAWKSFQELIAVQLYGLNLQPDLIIAFDGFNDIQHSYSMPIADPYTNISGEAFKRYKQWVEGGNKDLFKNLKIVAALKNPFIKAAVGMAGRGLSLEPPETATKAIYGKLATKLHYPLDFASIKSRQDFDPYNQETVNFYLKNEQLMAKAASTVNAKMLVALQPILYLKTPLSNTEREKLDSYAASVNFVVQGYLRMNQGLEALSRTEPNLRVVDMSNVFKDNAEGLFGDYCHFSKTGYEIVAKALFQEIQKSLNLPQDSVAVTTMPDMISKVPTKNCQPGVSLKNIQESAGTKM